MKDSRTAWLGKEVGDKAGFGIWRIMKKYEAVCWNMKDFGYTQEDQDSFLCVIVFSLQYFALKYWALLSLFYMLGGPFLVSIAVHHLKLHKNAVPFAGEKLHCLPKHYTEERATDHIQHSIIPGYSRAGGAETIGMVMLWKVFEAGIGICSLALL